MTLTCQEKDTNEVWVAGVHGLQDLLEGVWGVVLAQRATCNEVAHPEGVECRELLDLVRLFKPILPVVEVLVVYHAAHALKLRETTAIRSSCQFEFSVAAQCKLCTSRPARISVPDTALGSRENTQLAAAGEDACALG